MFFENKEIIETKLCRHCSHSFSITNKDIEFYEKVSPTFGGKKYLIPTPKLCPDCRAQNILSTRNERNLYKRTCDATGKDILSIHSPDKPFKVFDQNYWRGDGWNALDYGKDFNFSRPFFDQFIELFQSVPKISLNAPRSLNSEFTNQCQLNKDCYMLFCCGSNENCYYGMWNQDCKFCMDSLYIELSEHCYEVINAIQCYKCFFSKNLEGCSDIYFSRDLVNCKNCIFCVNLENKEYCISNKQYSKEEYLKEKENLELGNFSSLKKYAHTFHQFSLGFPVKFYQGKRNEKFSGDYIQNSKESYIAYNCRDNDTSKYCRDSWQIDLCFDLIETIGMEYCLQVEGTGYANHCLFSAKLTKADRVFYSSHCNGVQDLFGCVGLNNKSYCILNKQYTKEEYEELVPRIIEHMIKTGEWGEFFPSSISPFGYNETVAQEYFPLTRENVIPANAGIYKNEPNHLVDSRIKHEDEKSNTFLRGPIFNRSDYEAPFPKVEKIIPASKLPDDITKIPDDILNWAIECEVTKKPFRIIKQELEFYRKHNLPIPHKHPDQRHLERMQLRNPRKLFTRHCDKCTKEIQTTYAPERPEIVYCEECYNKVVY